MLGAVRRYLPTIFAIVGVLALAVAAGLFIVYGEAGRWVLTSAAIGVIFLVYALLERPEGVRETITGREAKYGTNSLILTVAFIGIVALLNVLGTRYTYRWDLTEGNDFSVSPQTIQILQQIDSPVKVTAFYRQDQPGREDLQDLLNSYTRHTDKISYEFVDPELKPGVAREYQIEAYGTTVLEAEGRRQTISSANEADVTSALLKLERGQPKKIGWITGHGELDPENFDRGGASEAKRLIQQENYQIESLTLLAQQEISTEYAALVLAGPREPLLPQEVEVLKAYLERGGKMLVMVEPRSPGNPSELLSAWGLEIGEGVVVDFALNLQGDPLTPAVVRYQPNPIMRAADQTGRYITVFPGATMVRAKQERDQALQITTIADSSPDRSWLESDERIDLRSVTFDEGKDVRGPIPMAVSVQRGTSGSAGGETPPATRIVAIGNATFASNSLLSFVQVPGNRDLLLNSLNWLAEEEQLMGVRSKVETDRSLFLTNTQQNLLLASSTLFLPLAVLALGAYVWWTRR